MPFKRCLSLLLACLMFLSLYPAALGESIVLTPNVQSVGYSFSLSGEEYARVFYIAATESGNFVVHGENGVFSGEIALPHSAAGGNVTVTVKTLDDKQRGQTQIALPAAADYTAPSGSSSGRVKNLLLTETPEGLQYSFSSTASYLMLHYSNRQQKGTYPVYPDENGLFSGEILLPLTYSRTLTTVQILSGSGTTLAEEKARKGYLAPKAVPSQEGRLSGITICIDPGHQENGRPVSEPVGPGLSGKTAGSGGMAQGKFTLRKESIVVLEIAMVLRDELIRQGATVVLTRDKEAQFLTNMERCAIAEEAGADIMLRLHCDTRESAKEYGISIYTPFRSTYAQAVADNHGYRHMGNLLLNAMKQSVGYEQTDATGFVTLSDQFVGNNWAKMPCFLIELGFLSNTHEDFLLSHPHHQQLLAEGMAQGVYDIALYRGLLSGE